MIKAPLKQLLKKGTEWMWLSEHGSAGQKLKHILPNQPDLSFYDPTVPVKLQVDASKSGIGACIIQEGHPIACASR